MESPPSNALADGPDFQLELETPLAVGEIAEGDLISESRAEEIIGICHRKKLTWPQVRDELAKKAGLEIPAGTPLSHLTPGQAGQVEMILAAYKPKRK